MTKTALLVIDVQTGLISESTYRKDEFISSLQSLLTACRGAGMPVVYVQHSDPEDREELPLGSEAWRIAHEVAPLDGEPVVEKRFNSAFRQTGLRALLDGMGTDTLIIAGMMTQYCIDATCKVAFEYGYSLVIPPETNTTLENEFFPAEKLHYYYNYMMWDRRFGMVRPVSEVCGDVSRRI